MRYALHKKPGCHHQPSILTETDRFAIMPVLSPMFCSMPLGSEGSEFRKHSDHFFEKLFDPVLQLKGYDVKRADEIPRPGIITELIIEALWKSDLVIADLSFHNPNVFYELSLRHSFGKPVIQVIRADESIPFDLAAIQTFHLPATKTTVSDEVRNKFGKMIDAVEVRPTLCVIPAIERLRPTPINIHLHSMRKSATRTIAVSGAQKVGKLTLCNGLAQQLLLRGRTVAIRQRGVKHLRDLGLTVQFDKNTRPEDYARFAQQHLEEFQNAIASGDEVSVFIRSVVDVLAFARVNSNLHENWMKLLEELVRLSSKLYTVYLFCADNFELTPEQRCKTDAQYRAALSKEIRAILGKHIPNYVTVTGTLDDRNRFALNIVNNVFEADS